jgi:hypothetical protein
MTAITDEGMRWAYRAQQTLLTTVSALTQRAVRRTLLGERTQLGTAQLAGLRQRYVELLRRDLANVEAGIYPRSLLFGIPWLDYARRLPRLAFDVPAIIGRMKRGGWRELPADVDTRAYPAYYRRTFHWQTDGYLSRRSAELYDVGVEFLFGGTADVMRRQVITPLVELQRRQSTPLHVTSVRSTCSSRARRSGARRSPASCPATGSRCRSPTPASMRWSACSCSTSCRGPRDARCGPSSRGSYVRAAA